ncbi:MULTISPECIES: acyl-CoA dehydrogenase family protein [unclassified Amycolatopsis]|uniref:acyl-CoA dehydrogenase family protein n=1 Tax=unclassified Amycolatopsis TaxID=2618356 RepID=UPI002E10B391|nr:MULTISPECIES: acyl-CoA dehydrogenase family protein [unclassified Amycolatopsis]WSJ78599.1 acyl-CoA/acyl-ACP dehydrogenase [Amycolatopsis sp. NBC_01307]WSK77841.1 acyl-CoA/acyl-ACP dehydrogenase [Amycolatopsis sp. NBC_01286]
MTTSVATVPAPDLAALPSIVAGLAARAGEHDREATFPHEGVDLVHAAGLLTTTVHPRYGGPGAGVLDTARLLAELGRGDPSVALVTAMTLFVHAGQATAPSWPDDVYREVLAESAERPVLINALRVEPELGSPTRGGLPATIARRTADGWRLTGRKIYSTGSVGLRWMIVWARTDEPEPRVGGFLIRADAPGITIEPTWDHLGLRASASHDVVFTDVPVPSGATAGLSTPDTQRPPVLTFPLALPALYLGVARNALEWLTGFLRERVPSGLGKPLSTLPRFQTGVGEIAARIAGAQEILFGLAARVDEGAPDAIAHAGVAKVLATRLLIEAVEQAVALAGNPGLTHGNPLQRHYRDVLCSRVHTPQDDAVLTGLGRSILG